MPQSLLVEAKDLESYIPVLDPRRLVKPALIKGKNFLFDVDGPRSAFASRFSNWYQFALNSRQNIREFRVNGRFFYGTPTGIWEINPVSLQPDLLLPVVTLKKYWPWTFAQVGNLFYFAQHDAGLWQWNDVTKEWRKVATPADAPVRGICLAYGRLVCLSDEVVFWSALDDGTDFAPSIVTGAGFQALSILSQTAYRVDPVSDGIIISTDKGWIKGENVAAQYIFRWYVLSRDVFSYSPNMATVVPDLGLLELDAHGFHISSGRMPTIWEPAMGEYFKTKYLIPMNKKLIGCVYMYYSHAFQQLFVGFAPNMREGTYTITFVFNFASQKWGTFDRPNCGTFEVTRFPFATDVPGFMDLNGYMRYFGAQRNHEVLCPGVSFGDVVHRLDVEPPIRIEIIEGVKTYIAVSEIHLTTEQPLLEGTITQSGLYDINQSQQLEEDFTAPVDPDWTSEAQ